MSILLRLDVEEKIKEVEKEKEIIVLDFKDLLETFRKMIRDGDKIEENVIDIFKVYINAIENLNKELNYLYKYKGEATIK